MTQTSFTDLNLLEPIMRSLKAEKYSEPTPIQAQSIPHLLEGGDLLGCAQTGTGKTAAFALPMLQRLHISGQRPQKRSSRSLVLTPTRELAGQISDSFRRYGRHLNLRYATIYGGVGYNPQVQTLLRGVDVLIATPGRLLDLLSQGHVRLDAVEMLVLDEADRMLDMGFIHDVRKILSQVPKARQTLLFSATMPKEVAHLADSVLSNPKKIQVTPGTVTADLIDDQVLFVEREDKRSLLLEVLRKNDVKRALIFTRTKHRANRLSRDLNNRRVRAEAIHGNKTQNARQRALKDFSSGRVRVLVATDIVSRGIDVAGISHVINYELPNEPESYVHRIGRTARAGSSGIALSFCDRDEAGDLAGIEKLLQRKVAVCEDHSHHAAHIADKHALGQVRAEKTRRGRRPGGQRGQRNSWQRSSGRRGFQSNGASRQYRPHGQSQI